MYRIFLDCQGRYTSLKENYSTDAKEIKTTLAGFMKIQIALNRNATHSSNETANELSTAALFMITSKYYIAELLLMIPGIDDRLERIHEAVKNAKSFLDTCKDYDLIEEEDKSLLKDDHVISREERIARYSREKAIDDKLKQMLAERKKSMAQKDASDDDEGEYDRQVVQLVLSSIIPKAFALINLSNQEIPFLERRKAEMNKPKKNMEAKEEEKEEHQPYSYKLTLENISQPVPDHLKDKLSFIPAPQQMQTSSNNKFGLNPMVQTVGMVSATSVQAMISHQTDARERLFHNSNPYTLEVEEWAEQEIAAGRLPGKQSQPVFRPMKRENGGFVLSSEEREAKEVFIEASEQGDEDDNDDDRLNDDELEAQRLKQTEWDNWADDHAKGEGAKYNTHSLYNLDKDK